MGNNRSLEAGSISAVQEIPIILWIRKVHNCFHKKSPMCLP